MEIVILRGIGFFLLVVIEASFGALGVFLGSMINGYPEWIIFLAMSIIMALQVLFFVVIRHYFKLDTNNFISESVL